MLQWLFSFIAGPSICDEYVSISPQLPGNLREKNNSDFTYLIGRETKK